MDEKQDVTPRGALRLNGKRQRLSKPSSGQRLSSSSNGRVNPFERDLLDRLHLPVWSPSIMQHPVDTPPRYDWAIDEISKLNPSKIEESPSTHQESESLSQEVEAKVQADIEQFFTNHNLPSPIIKRAVDKCVGTELSFPINLPPHVEEILNSFIKLDVADSGISKVRHHLDDYVDENKELNRSLGRKLEFSFDDDEVFMNEDTQDMSMRSDDININIAQRHGALIMSPNAQKCEFLSPASVSTPIRRKFNGNHHQNQFYQHQVNNGHVSSDGNCTQEMLCSTPS